MWSFEEITFGQDIVATILIFISWENQAANPVDLVSDLVQFWCIGMERMDFVLLMDRLLSTP